MQLQRFLIPMFAISIMSSACAMNEEIDTTEGGQDEIFESTPEATADAAALAVCNPSWGAFDARVGKYFKYEGVNIRTGPSVFCGALGLGYTSHDVRLDCWRAGDDGFAWTHLWDKTTNVYGWSRNDQLWSGASVKCP